MAGEQQRGQRGPGMVLAGVSAAIVILVAALAITAAQAPPPAIAEISPDAVQQIKKAPSEQTSDAGEGEGGAGGGGVTTTTTTASLAGGGVSTTLPGTPPPIVRARVRRCVGDPPRQIEDPQSPPCVPYWQGDNGGATSRGVTADTIKIAMPTVYTSPLARSVLEGFFNKRFEFYGRKIQLVSAGGGSECVGFKAAAADLEAHGFFGVLDQNHDDASCFYAELARRKIVGTSGISLFTESRLRELAPYTWQYPMSDDREFAAIGEWTCNRLVGRNAEFAKGLQLNQPRKFGIIVQYNNPDREPDTSPIEQALRRCGSPLSAIYRMKQSADGQENLNQSQSAILAMERANVTSVICLCQIFAEAFLGSYATGQAYFPEWLLSTYGGNDFNFLIRSVGWPESEQRTQILGTSMLPRQANTDDQPFWWMIQEMNPNVRKDDLEGYGSNIQNIYRAMLLMASGLQMAGPHLTPESFEAGLHQAVFPNPEHRNRPGKVGFADKDHSMTNDTVEFWWSEAEPSPDDVGSNGGSPGTLCYIDRAERRDNGRFPKGRSTFFDLPCFSGRNP
jgi:hypothetical protein